MMFKYLALVVFLAYMKEAQADCLPEPNCDNCSVDCKGNVRAVYVADDCCESCVSTIGLGDSCDPSIEPNPNCPPGPKGDPRVPTSNAICAIGLRCDQRSQTCVKN
uniref:IGFBP N-terminal domain-containing protein n=1 Tax=Latrodectus hesperus TaxID=256737 RepID=E7D1S5_LATHE|nr:hypothetical protein [Latrodectus hesperus]